MMQAEPAQISATALIDNGSVTPQPLMLPAVFRVPAIIYLRILMPIVPFIALIGWAIWRANSSFESSFAGPIFLTAMLGVYVILVMTRVPLGATIFAEALEVRYMLWRRRVPYSAITNVTLVRGLGSTERVRIDLNNFVMFGIGNLRNDSIALYDAIREAWSPGHAEPGKASAASSDVLTKLATPYVPPWRADPSLRRFPSWMAPALLVIAAVIALAAPRRIWLALRGTRESPPDTKELAAYPHLATGWVGAPVPIFPGETLGRRWNVDYKTGAFTHSQTDFYIGDSIPINVTRVFLNKERSGAFGTGTSISYDIYPIGNSARFTYMVIMTPDGENFHFTRISPGTSWEGAVYRADYIRGGGESPFAGATISWNGNGWTLKSDDGTLMTFPAVHGQISEGQGALLSIENQKGDLIRIDRDRKGNILKITSPHGGYVRFQHDYENRIISATDYLGKTVVYDYDVDGHLIRVDDPKDGISHYAYQHGSMVRIVKPDGSAWIRVDYDERGRVAEIFLGHGRFSGYKYEADADGTITAVDVRSSDGPPDRISLTGGIN